VKKHERIKALIDTRVDPFTTTDIANAALCSNPTVSAAIHQHFSKRLRWYWRPLGHGNFNKVFFPLSWSDDQCWTYINSKTRNGKSRATLHGGGL